MCMGERQVQLGDLVYRAEVSNQMSVNAIGLNFVMRENLAVRVGDFMSVLRCLSCVRCRA